MKKRFLLLHLITIGLALNLNGQPPSNEQAGQYSFDYRKIIPGMPENASIGAYGNVPLNTGTGKPNLSFNLYTLSKDGVNVPISISYLASAIKYNDVPSAVGMKWSLDAGGSVNRSVNGIVDEDFLLNNLPAIDAANMDYRNLHVNSHPMQDSSKLVAKNTVDFSLDNYFYNFPGHSGSMYLGKNKTFRADKEYRNLKITYSAPPIGNYESFQIKDNAGNTYIFADYTDNSVVYGGGKYNKQAKSSWGAKVAWKLRKIITATKQVITFDYISYYYEYTTLDSERWTVYLQNPGAEYASCIGGPYTIGTNEGSYQTTRFVNTAWLLSKISTDDQDVLFNYTQDAELAVFQMKLSSMKVYSKIAADTIKRFSFTHAGDYLLSYEELNKNGSSFGQKTQFDYNSILDELQFGPYSKNRDIFGYYNNSSNERLMANDAAFSYYYVWPKANRVPNNNATQGLVRGITYPTGGKTNIEYELNRNIYGSDTIYAPGVRVRSIEDIDVDDKQYSKKIFHYRMNDGYRMSQVMINNENPAYLEPTMVGVFYSEMPAQTWTDDFFYTEVVTENIGRNNSSVRLFEKDYYTIQYELFGKTSPLLIKKEIFNTDTFHLQKSTTYNYEYTSVDSVKIGSYVMRKAISHLGNYAYEGDGFVYNFCPPATVYQGYDQDNILRPMLFDLKTITTKEYAANGDSLTTVVNNTYNQQGLVKKVETVGSDTITTTKITEYPADYPANPTLVQMKDSFLLSQVVKEQFQISTAPKKEKINTYAFNAGGFFTINNQVLKDVPSAKTETLNFYGYNSKGLLLSSGKPGDVKTSYIWDYLNELPVAEVINADTSSIAYTSFEADGKGRWTFSGAPVNNSQAITGKKVYSLVSGNISKTGLNTTTSYILTYWSKAGSLTVTGTQAGWPILLKTISFETDTWKLYEHKIIGQISISLTGSIVIDELRLYPENAQMSSYTYDPLVGVTSQSDPNGRITYYQYDAANRLSLVRDQHKNVLKRVCYNYKGQPENCPQNLYWNNALSKTFSKTCSAGNIGSAFIYSIPAGTYSSAISQSTADSIALSYFNTQGQNYANTNGSCVPIWYNVLKSGTFTKTCTLPYTGTTTQYIVYANTYSSLISQAAADALAQADVNANGQNYANTTGTCAIVCNPACTAVHRHCVNGVCEIGIKVYTSQELNTSGGGYTCTYHWEWSDGYWSQNYTEFSSQPCIPL